MPTGGVAKDKRRPIAATCDLWPTLDRYTVFQVDLIIPLGCRGQAALGNFGAYFCPQVLAGNCDCWLLQTF